MSTDTTTVPFESVSAPSTPLIDEPTDAGNRKRLLVLGGVAAAVVVGLLAYFLVFAGGGGNDTPSATPPVKHVAPAAPAAPAAQPPVQRINAKSFGRDPFKALIAPADPIGAVGGTGTTTVPPAPTTTTGGTATGGTTTGGTSTVGGTGSGTTTGGTGTVGSTPVPVVTADHTFRVVGVSSDQTRITVRVDGKSYSGLKAGDVFATYFKVVVIGGKVNGFQFGDEKFSVFGTKLLHIAA
jgi:hypothetical protein